jgi:hypothetical protein
MKRITTAVLAAALLLGATSPVLAQNVKTFKGHGSTAHLPS